MKQYYYLYDTTFHTKSCWHGDIEKADFLLQLAQMVIPLGTRRPRNVSRETIKEF